MNVLKIFDLYISNIMVRGLFSFLFKLKREELGLTQAQLAKKLGVSENTISAWENINSDERPLLYFCTMIIISICEVLSRKINNLNINDLIVDGKLNLNTLMQQSLWYKDSAVLQRNIKPIISDYDQRFFDKKYSEKIDRQLSEIKGVIYELKSNKPPVKTYVKTIEYLQILEFTHECLINCLEDLELICKDLINYLQKLETSQFDYLVLFRCAENFNLSLLWVVFLLQTWNVEIKEIDISKDSLGYSQGKIGLQETAPSKSSKKTTGKSNDEEIA